MPSKLYQALMFHFVTLEHAVSLVCMPMSFWWPFGWSLGLLLKILMVASFTHCLTLLSVILIEFCMLKVNKRKRKILPKHIKIFLSKFIHLLIMTLQAKEVENMLLFFAVVVVVVVIIISTIIIIFGRLLFQCKPCIPI
jgi:hypothetical protein